MAALALLIALLFSAFASAQEREENLYWFPKPTQRTPWRAPMKPVTRLADLKARHHGQSSWRELVIDDGNSKAWMIQEAPGPDYARRLYPDSPAWWAVLEGRIRFEIEKPEGGFEVFEATKGCTSSRPSVCCTRSRWWAASRQSVSR